MSTTAAPDTITTPSRWLRARSTYRRNRLVIIGSMAAIALILGIVGMIQLHVTVTTFKTTVYRFPGVGPIRISVDSLTPQSVPWPDKIYYALGALSLRDATHPVSASSRSRDRAVACASESRPGRPERHLRDLRRTGDADQDRVLSESLDRLWRGQGRHAAGCEPAITT